MALTTVNWTLAYTVPAGRTAVIRGLFLYQGGAAAAFAGFAIKATSPTAVGDIFFQDSAAPAGKTVVVPRDVILDPGEKLWAFCSSGAASAYGFGSLLLGAPS